MATALAEQTSLTDARHETAAVEATAATSPDAKRLTFLGDQLTADEAAIAAINKALIQAGYKAAAAQERAVHAAAGNERMDRQGGGPVPWQEFYGRTARSFILHDPYSSYYQIRRPGQFNYVYRANDTAAANARREISAMGSKIESLLARRRKLETEQSQIWATIALESVAHRDISLRPLYRNELAAAPADPQSPRLAALRALVAYIRNLDRLTQAVLARLGEDQGAAYIALRDGVQQEQTRLNDALASFMDGKNAADSDLKDFSESVNLARRMQALCKDIVEAYQKGLEADDAKEETRKQLYRGTLQDSLFTLVETFGHLDEAATKMSESWAIQPVSGTQAFAADAKPGLPPASGPQAAHERRVDLLKLVHPQTDAVHGEWAFKKGALVSEGDGSNRLAIRYVPPAEYDLRVVFRRVEGNRGIGVVGVAKGKQFAFIVGSEDNTLAAFGPMDGLPAAKNKTARRSAGYITNMEKYELVVHVRNDGAWASMNGKTLTNWKTDYSELEPLGDLLKLDQTRSLGLLSFRNWTRFEEVEIVEIAGEGKPF